ncbi:bile acid:sodium symporter family protein [Conexibacter sp. JD483]|uniref:bile acid:sodium symporter family protein n=1 Tax=unclassified Conexibacter TaxID=2627773 RepID=UPI00271F307D|nr:MULTISPECIES: bile acid:sodium symporter family protein [unclassified Conexibacter]MDO8184012.1 bile acid:sodium symporter family protein [Conexibacter sp. CPCC 205706]MDO8197004.1 bile acid:sodium symporter family protein [Conexibacter sp. CPCC 205762]MDR9367920.1 bile acid:sodium symporter family protein [Conexibacter sp. JD483]
MEPTLTTSVLLPAALATIMIALGLELTLADFRRVVRQPRGVAIGLVNLVVVSPALAFGVATLFDLPAGLAVGLVLLGASPGGTMANVLTHLARGDTALSLTMTAVSSVAAAITVPAYLGLASDHFDAGALVGDLAMGSIVARVLLLTIVPVAVGMAVRERWPRRVAAARPLIGRFAAGLFLLVVIGAVASEHDVVLEHAGAILGAVVVLNVTALAISFAVSKLAGLDDRQATAIALELGIHNATLAIAVGSTLATELSVPAAAYGAIMFLSGGLFARAMHRRNAAVRAA